MTVRYESHPGKPLKEHLHEVAHGARARLDHPALRHRELLRETAYIVGLAHDLGKYTPFFQAHLKGKGHSNGTLARHSFLGSLLAAWLLLQRLERLPDAPGKEFLPLLGYLVVHRHHGDLVAPEAILPPLGDPEEANGDLRLALDALNPQLKELMKEYPYWVGEWEELDLKDAVAFVKEPEIKPLFAELGRLNYRLMRLEAEEGARLCLWGQLLFSALIDADKRSAARLARAGRHVIPPDLVERFLKERCPEPHTDLDRQRWEFQQTVRRTVEALDPKEIAGSAFSLTAPTGLGKTLAALDAALHLRDKLRTLWNNEYAPRIVYALPFITIIEQNYREFYSVFQTLYPHKTIPESLLLRHHYLAEISYRVNDDSLPLDQALLMVEAWESEVVVTTFVQLFQSLVGYRNSFLKKLYNLIGAIVVLDEVQSLPMELWPFLRKVFPVLQQELGLVVVQMTATKPNLFTNTRVRELHPDAPSLFHRQKRTRLEIYPKEVSLDEWVDRVLEIYDKSGSVLCVLNTIRTSLQVYRMLRRRLGSRVEAFGLHAPPGQDWLVHLSTNIVPQQRQQRVQELKDHLKNGGRALVVSTQVIEAGVDISFPEVVRDRAPIDAIIQAAGRCNREGKRPIGHVHLLPLENGGCPRVYGVVHDHVTKRLLGHLRDGVPESEYAALVELYFRESEERLSQEKADQLWKAYTRLAYDKLAGDETLSEFHLIESPQQLSIVVPLTPDDVEWLAEFKHEVIEERDPRKRRKAYLKHRRRLHDLTVHPLLQRAFQNLPPSLDGSETLRWVPYKQMEQFYHTETGFIWEPSELPYAWTDD